MTPFPSATTRLRSFLGSLEDYVLARHMARRLHRRNRWDDCAGAAPARPGGLMLHHADTGCPAAQRAFGAYLGRTLPEAERARLAGHLAHCGRCAARLVQYVQMRRLTQEASTV